VNDNQFAASISKTEEWKSALQLIVARWRLDKYLLNDMSQENAWKIRFNNCEPWELAHMANILLEASCRKDFENRNIANQDFQDPETVRAYVSLITEIALDHSHAEKRELLEIHEQIMRNTGESIKAKLQAPWPWMTWAYFGTSNL